MLRHSLSVVVNFFRHSQVDWTQGTPPPHSTGFRENHPHNLTSLNDDKCCCAHDSNAREKMEDERALRKCISALTSLFHGLRPIFPVTVRIVAVLGVFAGRSVSEFSGISGRRAIIAVLDRCFHVAHTSFCCRNGSFHGKWIKLYFRVEKIAQVFQSSMTHSPKELRNTITTI